MLTGVYSYTQVRIFGLTDQLPMIMPTHRYAQSAPSCKRQVAMLSLADPHQPNQEHRLAFPIHGRLVIRDRQPKQLRSFLHGAFQ